MVTGLSPLGLPQERQVGPRQWPLIPLAITRDYPAISTESGPIWAWWRSTINRDGRGNAGDGDRRLQSVD